MRNECCNRLVSIKVATKHYKTSLVSLLMSLYLSLSLVLLMLFVFSIKIAIFNSSGFTASPSCTQYSRLITISRVRANIRLLNANQRLQLAHRFSSPLLLPLQIL